ncbi:hypothetical protein SD70_21340 [Gordoniibacillus kamchatkensis]|uniref:Aminodeoxychorismate lyase n=1 Tax=Gordoniibacillus kamchatkensis TaxID=1590651 RepID=A0ABR5AF70_9BACL|nr:hypothetical protein [Paenibacillus sp. VKM B-2647]KIL39220.1 hypothetical protein SD70_21340 [Paenibacillus sp. VKM B-2647]
MFKNRAMLSGVGIGLIAGAILLQVMLVAKGTGAAPMPAGKAAPEDMDPKQLKEVAQKYYQVYDKNEKLFTQADVDKKVQDALKAQPNPNAGAAGKKVAVYVSPGLIATQVAELLYRSGVVADRNAFEKMLNEQRLTDKIQVGYHVFEGTPDPQQVVQTLLSAQ